VHFRVLTDGVSRTSASARGVGSGERPSRVSPPAVTPSGGSQPGGGEASYDVWGVGHVDGDGLVSALSMDRVRADRLATLMMDVGIPAARWLNRGAGESPTAAAGVAA
jgi:hypothetical protein